MSRGRATQSHSREKYKKGQWNPAIVTSALEKAQAAEHPTGWIDYLDICLSIQGVTPEQWLNVAQSLRNFSSCSPKLLLRLRYLISTPGVIESLSESCRQEFGNTLNSHTRYSYAGLLSDIRMSGYLGCRLTHYPGLLAQLNTSTRYLPSQESLCKPYAQKAKTLAAKITPFNELVRPIVVPADVKSHVRSTYRIAVVGNSPVIRQHKKGSEIDSADIVIRFNNSAVSKENKKHCGIRTDLWVMSPATSVHHCPSDARAIVVSGLHSLTRPSFYWRKLIKSDKLLGEFPAAIWYDLVKQFQAPPSAGALLLASLETLNNSIDVRYYGFTTNRRDIHGIANHYSDPVPRSTRHNWQAETDWLADRLA